jgi:hypothetical protein
MNLFSPPFYFQALLGLPTGKAAAPTLNCLTWFHAVTPALS